MGNPGQAHVLRVNVLEQCQYRCPYCLPGSVSPYTSNSSRLQVEEYRRLARAFSSFELRKVRFTGGEPLIREELPEIASVFRDALPDAELAVTTNGQFLSKRLRELIDAGIDRVTVHVDSLQPDRYRRLMGDGDVAEVLAAIREAKSSLRDVKLNMVVQRDQNDDEVAAFLEWSRESRIQVRFIELMNTGSAVLYTRKHFFSGEEIVSRASALGPVERLPRKDPSDPAALFRAANGVVFGLIASDTQPFCDACNRLRLTPSGKLRGCLYQNGGIELGKALREGATDEALSELIGLGIRNKRSYHPSVLVERAPFSMSETGG